MAALRTPNGRVEAVAVDQPVFEIFCIQSGESIFSLLILLAVSMQDTEHVVSMGFSYLLQSHSELADGL
jgi:hypothetical protein